MTILRIWRGTDFWPGDKLAIWLADQVCHHHVRSFDDLS